MYKHIKIVMLLLIVIVLHEGCKKDSRDATPGTGGCSVSKEEFMSLPRPTYNAFIAASNAVVQADSSLLKDENRLRCEIYHWLKDHPGQQKITYDPREIFTDDEWDLIFLKTFKAVKVWRVKGTAEDGALYSYNCDLSDNLHNTKADAIRHAYWNALMVRSIGFEDAATFAAAHENRPGNPISESQMDSHNNSIGRNLAVLYPEASDEELLVLLNEMPFYYLEDEDQPIPAGALNSLVFFANKKPYDVSLSGSLTNPDSGGPWDCVFNLVQCGDQLRGQFTITRGSDLQKRRFNGSINNDGSITLVVSDPYYYEHGGNMSYCTGMYMTLYGNQDALAGEWISTNCVLGGYVQLH